MTQHTDCRQHRCPCETVSSGFDLSRRQLLQLCGIGVAGAAMSGLSWPALAAGEGPGPAAAPRRRQPLVVKPVFTYPLPTPRPQTSWRNWGGIQTQADIDQEAARIRGELDRLQAGADYPVQFLPLAVVRRADELRQVPDVAGADTLLVWAAGDGGGDLMAAMNPLGALQKDLIFFVRHQSGPLYYWYEGIMARYLHQHTDVLAVPGVDYDDVVVDRLDEIDWRLRALCGRKNTRQTRIVAIGRAGGWGPGGKKAPDLAKERWQIDVQTVSYDELGRLMKDAFADPAAMQAARQRADEYLKDPGLTVEVDRTAVDHAFLLEQVFRALMAKAEAQAITISGCMRTIMPHRPDQRLPDAVGAERRRVPGLLRERFRGHPGGDPAGADLRAAAVPERSHLPARRRDHVGPLHRAAADGWPDAGAGPAGDAF